MKKWKWVEIFKGGKQTDSLGKEHDGDKLIERAVSLFNADEHEPPVVVGHPRDNAPAFGWVRGIRRRVKDGVLFLDAKMKVVPEFAAAVKAGLYKKRSASFYPDGRLRHVGFLGAMPPAVKALKDIGFSDEGINFEFEESGGGPAPDENNPNQKGKKEMDLKEFFDGMKSFFGLMKEAGPVPNPDLPKDKSFSEEDLEKAKKEAADKAKQEAKAEAEKEFAEKDAKDKAEARKKHLSDRVDAMVTAGKLPPAFAEEFKLQLVACDSTEVEFGEGKKGSLAEKMLQEKEKAEAVGGFFSEMVTNGNVNPDFAEAQADQKLGESIAATVNPAKE